MNVKYSSYFKSKSPVIHLVNSFIEPYNNSVATARTCYSSKVIDVPNVRGEGLEGEALDKRIDMRDRIALSVFDAGHHTILQHTHFQFTLEHVSRHAIWSFFHSHPHYNSEQSSQRYVKTKVENVVMPEENSDLYAVHYTALGDAYHKLCELLYEPSAEEYYKVFPSRRGKDKWNNIIKKKAQEVARYVLPIGTHTTLYHTVSLITLIRYYYTINHSDVPTETRVVVQEMVDQVLAQDPELKVFFDTIIPVEDISTYVIRDGSSRVSSVVSNYFKSENKSFSVLRDYNVNPWDTIIEAVSLVLGEVDISHREALDYVLSANQNRSLGYKVNVSMHDKLARIGSLVNYVFLKRLSHAADSQDQRHRMTPAARPVFLNQVNVSSPDYYVPTLISKYEEPLKYYHEVMGKAWDRINEIREAATDHYDVEFSQYAYPNAVNLYFVEAGSLSALHHKYKMRLCYNAQEEIWNASVEEVQAIRKIHPEIGEYFLPPCSIRKEAGVKPFCPEGDRYCGVPVWKKTLDEYERVI